MSVYNRQNQEFVSLAETSGILQNMTSSNIEYVVCADGETPEFNTGIRLSPSKKLKFSQTVGVSYVRVVGNTTGDIIVTPNDEASSGGGSTTRIINHVQDWQPDTLYPTGTLVIYNNVLYKCVVPNHKIIFDPADWVVIGAGNDGGKGISVWSSNTNYKVDDIILFGNTLYVCVNEHVSSTEFGDDTEYWVVITDNAGTVLPDWQAREKYEKDEIVNVGGFIYRCKSPHISRDTFATMNDVVGDEDYWELISWVDWHTETQYLKDQIVYCDGALWRCLTNHVSDNTSISNDSDKWIKICGYTLPVASDSILGGVKVGSGLSISNDGVLSVEFAPNNDIVTWVAGTAYNVGQYVIYNNNLYECKTANNDASFDETKWQLIGASGGNFQITDWESGETYAVGDLVIYNDVLYQCTTANSDVSFDSDKWTSIGEPERDLQQWESGKSYKVGHFVIKDNKLYQCATANSDTTFDATKWTEIGDMSDIQAWESGTSYSANDYVIYDNRVYKCTTANSDTTFTASNWQDMGSIQSYITEWQSGKAYTVGTLVIKDKAIYKCTTANSDLTFTPSKWEKQIDSDKSLTAWVSGTSYKAGQYVVYQGKIYECTTANNDVAFDDTKWSLINEATGLIVDSWKTKTVYKKNQIVEYIGDMYMCLEGHTSDMFKRDYDNGLWLKVDHSTPDFKKGSFYAKDSTIIYEGSTYRCVKSHVAWGDSPLEQPALSLNYIDPETGAFNGAGMWWYDPHPSNVTREQLIDLGDYYNVTDFTIRVLVPTGKGSDNITSLALYAMPDNDITSTPTATLFEKTYADDGFYMNTGEKKFEFNAVTCRYLKVVATPTFDGSWGHCIIYVTGYAFGDDGVYWEKVGGGAGVVDWEANTNYNTNTLIVQNNKLYVCVQDHTSSSSFDTDCLAGKWQMLCGGSGNGSVNNPLGTIISYMGTTPPDNYLACDGSVYNITDYQELADHINTQFGSYDFFGGNGTTTFAVPDLRGEFLHCIRYNNPTSYANYSTTEQRIGTWIDGKPLYQITIQDTMPTVTTHGTRETKNIDIDNLKVKYLVKLDGFLFNGTGGMTFINSIINIANTVPSLFEAQCVKSNDTNINVDLLHLGSTAAWASNQPVYITIQYTKTTD